MDQQPHREQTKSKQKKPRHVTFQLTTPSIVQIGRHMFITSNLI